MVHSRTCNANTDIRIERFLPHRNFKQTDIAIYVIFYKEWQDDRLSWNAATYPDVDHVYTLDSEVWKPELFIDNS